MSYKLEVNLPQKTYPLFIKKDVINYIGSEIRKIYNNKKITVITDENVKNLYGKALIDNLKSNGYDANIISVKPGEKSKSIEVLTYVYDRLLDNQMTRKDLIIAFGGGVVGDLAGFAAATFLRGVKYVQIPTTLIAQIDSSIGGKVAVNLERGKNLVGSFYHPEAVYIDSSLLKTLPEKFLNDGMGEVIKYACIKDKQLFTKLQEINIDSDLFSILDEIIYRCCIIKKEIVEIDEKESGDRMLLNFGHTMGHAVENIFNYERYTHGEAVAIGMYIITKRSEELGLTKKGTADALKDLLVKFKLPFELPDNINSNVLLEIMNLDKKSEKDHINLVLLSEIGHSFIKKVPKEDLRQYLFK